MTVVDHYDVEADACLYVGDCANLLDSIPSESACLIVSSPPYNIR